jgi:zinc protease
MTLDRSRAPLAGPARPFDFPSWQGHRLANGLRVMVLSTPAVPLVHVELLLGLGAEGDPLDRRGLTPLAAGLLDEGTEALSSKEIAETVELLGATLYSTGDWDGVFVGSTSLAPHLGRLFEIAADIVRHPTFPTVELERLRGMRLAELANRARQPAFAAGRCALALLYGASHTYGATLSGTAEGLSAITSADLESWHARRARPDLATLIAVGDTSLVDVVALADRHLADWRGDPGDPLPAVSLPEPEPRRVEIVDRPGAAQTELRLVRPGLPRAAVDYLPARLVNLIFGGKFTSRLNLNLREERGITYSVHSRLSRRRGPGPFTISCAVDNDAAGVAVGEILRELDRLATEPASAAEIDDARNYLLGTFPYRIQTLDGLADHLAQIALHDLPDDYYQTLPAAILDLSAGAIAESAARLLRSDDLVIVAAGPADSLRGQLEPFGTLVTASHDLD